MSGKKPHIEAITLENIAAAIEGIAVSLDDFIQATTLRFEQIDSRLDARFGQIDSRFEQLEESIGDLARMTAAGFQDMEERFDARFIRLEDKMDSWISELRTVQFDHKKVVGRVENLEVHAFGSIQ